MSNDIPPQQPQPWQTYPPPQPGYAPQSAQPGHQPPGYPPHHGYPPPSPTQPWPPHAANLPAPPHDAHSRAIPEGNKGFVVTLALSVLLGMFGVDRFYLRKTGSALLKLVTLGGFGYWWLIDVILTLTGHQRDSLGLRLHGYEKHKKTVWKVIGGYLGISLALSIFVRMVFSLRTAGSRPSDGFWWEPSPPEASHWAGFGSPVTAHAVRPWRTLTKTIPCLRASGRNWTDSTSCGRRILHTQKQAVHRRTPWSRKSTR